MPSGEQYNNMLGMRTYLANQEKLEALWHILATAKDDLLPCLYIKVDETDRYAMTLTAGDSLIPVFSEPENVLVIDYLTKSKEIWHQTSLRVTYAPTICGRAPYFGVPFHKAVEIALKKGVDLLPNLVRNRHRVCG
jgi:hypothetical protein